MQVSGDWDGTIDFDAFSETVATLVASEIATNLTIGQRPSGKGSMPRARTTKQPRGIGSATVASIHARKVSDGKYVIAADESVPGKLRRILKGVRLTLPPLQPIYEVALAELVDPGKNNLGA